MQEVRFPASNKEVAR